MYNFNKKVVNLKKILIISGNNHLFTSGVDLYTSRIIRILKKENCIVHEYSFGINMSEKDYEKKDDIKIIYPSEKRNDCKKKMKWFFKNVYNVLYYSNKQLNKLIDEYDLVIDCTLMLVRSKKLLNSKKFLYVQHQNANFFEMRHYGLGRPIALFLLWITGFKNSYKLARNIVFYDEENKKYIENKFGISKSKKYFEIINSNITEAQIKANKIIKDNIYKNNNFSQNVIYIGRITVEQKRMNDVNRLLSKTKNKLDVWGFGTYEKKLKKNKNIVFHGKINHEDVMSTLSKSKFSLLMSNYEGLSTFLVESICSMTPIIVRNSCLSSIFLTDNNNNGFLLENKFNIEDYSYIYDEISELNIDKLKKLSNNCYKFALKHLVYEKFEEKWLKVYKELTK